MKCEDVAGPDVASDYLLGVLPEEERDAYEAHFFECDRCFAELEVARSTQAVLKRESQASPPVPKPQRAAPWLPIAAALAAASIVGMLWRSGPPPVLDPSPAGPASPAPSAASMPPSSPGPLPDLSPLAQFDPPPYEPPRLRGAPAADTAGFDRAMARYRRGDFAGAVPGLEEHLRRHADDQRAAFYLGVSLLATHQAEAAARRLERVASAGDSPYEEEAWYLLAKAHIERGDVGAAIAALDRTAALKGERAGEARALRERLAALGARAY
jgi:tetratricopeptide (TPR) repeat protein